MLIYYVIIGVVWISAGYFFLVIEVSNKSLKPEQNRDLNQECLFLNFYDSHDIWHLLSSCGLLLSAVRAIALSFPCRYCRVENLTKLIQRERNSFAAKIKETVTKIRVLDVLNARSRQDMNSVPHYIQTAKCGRGPCEPTLTSYYAHHS